ncbi:transcriptional regulator [Lysobacter capsici]|uniref:transcriptional regulator n=1 Tax=Lysobacter capsici TaxID=435897 RepID=UPI000ABF7FDE|nr:transcriptional regulator [Lysobacter capsici]
MPVPASQAPFANATQRREVVLGEANLAIARDWADSFGVPLAYLYADNADLAEVILAFGLLPESEQRRLALELKARVSPPATRARPARKARAKPRTG